MRGSGAACMSSLLRHSECDFDFTIVSDADPAPFADRIRRSFAGNSRASIEIKRFAIPESMHFPLPGKLTLETYMRFWIADLLPWRKRALYLDADTIATAPIEPLWHTDLQGKVLGAVEIPGSTRPATHGMPPGSPFFNAGVLLLDLEAWRERDYCRRCLDYLRANPDCALDGDQDVLNLVTMGDWLQLPFEWNVINPFYRPGHHLGLSKAAVASVCQNARIVHFNGRNKPWNYLDEHPRKADYLMNLAQTEWRDWRPADRTTFNIVRKHVAAVMPHPAKVLVRTALSPARWRSKLDRGRVPATH